MGVTAFFYASAAGIDQVEAALRRVYSDVLGGTHADRVDSAHAIELIDRNDDDALVAMWTDGAYTCWAESDVALAEDEPLAALSAQLGTVLVAMVGDHGGSYAFGVFRNGEVVRWLQNDEAYIAGAPIPEEAGIDAVTLSDTDVETLWERFGLQPFLAGVPPFRVLRGTPA